MIEIKLLVPDNPTNGDIILAAFPDASVDNFTNFSGTSAFVDVKDIDGRTTYRKSWFDASYKNNQIMRRNKNVRQ